MPAESRTVRLWSVPHENGNFAKAFLKPSWCFPRLGAYWIVLSMFFDCFQALLALGSYS